MNNPAFNQTEQFVDVVMQFRDNAHIILLFGFLKLWMYRNQPMYSDLVLYAGLWFECEINMDILIATNTKYIGTTSVMVYSLCRSHENVEVDIYLAYHDLKEEDIERLQKIVFGFKQKKLHPLDVGTEFATRLAVAKHFTIKTYYRILAVNLLPQDMDRILYLDVDMLIKRDVDYENLWNRIDII